MLLALLPGPLRKVFGIGGTGGLAPMSGDIAPFARDGLVDGDLNVRSVIDPELSLLCRPAREGGAPATLPLATDDIDPLLTIRFV